MTSSGQPLKQNLLLVVPPPQRKASLPAAREGRPAPRTEAGGDRSSAAHVVAGVDTGGEVGATRMRLVAAQALGELASACGDGVSLQVQCQKQVCTYAVCRRISGDVGRRSTSNQDENMLRVDGPTGLDTCAR